MSVDQFLEALLQSLLIDEADLRRILGRVPAGVDDTAEALADWLVALGALTRYQSRRLLHGDSIRLLVGSYEIRDLLGRGGMGAVYLARDRRTGRLCALKLLGKGKRRLRKRDVLRFQRETELGKRLLHPNIALAYEAGESNGLHYLAMEYVPGETLFRLVRASGPVEVYWAARWIRDVAVALDYAHQMGVVHRDLKPSNVIATPDGSAKLLDLGLARWFSDDHNEDRVIGERRIVGSFDYIAPEQATNSAQADSRSDIYGMGCLLYFLLVGNPPFYRALHRREKIAHHRSVTPEAIGSVRSDVPADFVTIVERMLAKDPDDRPQLAAEVRDLLTPWIARLGGFPPPMPGVRPSSEEEFPSTDEPILLSEGAEAESPDGVLAAEAKPGLWTRMGRAWLNRHRKGS